MDQYKLAAIARGITQGDIVSLDLTNKQLTAEDLKTLAAAIESHKSIVQRVVLDYNDLTIFNGSNLGLECFLKAIRRKKNLISLSLKNTNLNDALFVEFVSVIVISGLPKLQYLTLSHNLLTAASINYWHLLTKSCPNLQVLDLSNNALGDRCCVMLADQISNCVDLRRLSIANIGITNIGFHAISAALQYHSKIQVLDASDNKISDVGALAFVGLLSASATLKEVYLDLCEINNFGAKEIFNLIIKNSTLRKISLAGNNISILDGLAEVISENTTLEVIILSLNKLTCESVIPAFLNLPRNHTLNQICLDNNYVAETAASILAKFLPANISLISIDLSHNCISLESARLLLEATASHPSLDRLNLSSNIFSPSDILPFMNSKKPKRIKYIIDDDGSDIDSTSLVSDYGIITRDMLYSEPNQMADSEGKSALEACAAKVKLSLAI